MRQVAGGLASVGSRRWAVLRNPFAYLAPQRSLDRLAYLAGVFGPLMTIPQAVKIWSERSAEGVSLASWVAYLACSVIWISYGTYHRNRPLVLTYSLWAVLCTLIVVGLLVFR